MKAKFTFLFLVFVVSFSCTNRNAHQKQPVSEKPNDNFVPEYWTKNSATLSGLKHVEYREYSRDRYNWRYGMRIRNSPPPPPTPENIESYISQYTGAYNYDSVKIKLPKPIKSNRVVFPVNSMLPVIESTETLVPLSNSNKSKLLSLIFTTSNNDSFAIYGRVSIYNDIESYIIATKSKGTKMSEIGMITSYLINIKNGRLLSMIELSSYNNPGLGGSTTVSFHLPDGIIINKSVFWSDAIDDVAGDTNFNELYFTVFKVEKTGFVKMLGPDDVRASN